MGSIGTNRNITNMTKTERLAAVRREVESGSNTSASELSKKYNLSMEETGQVVFEHATKQRTEVPTKSAQQKERKVSTQSKTTSSTRIEAMTNSLRDNPNGTLIGTSGNITHVIEADKVKSSYTRPDGVRVPTSKIIYSVTPITKGRNSATTKVFKNQKELNDYMNNTGAKWKSRKNRLSNKQKAELFD